MDRELARYRRFRGGSGHDVEGSSRKDRAITMTRSSARARGLLAAATLFGAAAAFAQDQAGPCRSRQGLVDMAEIISVRQACDKVFPGLRATTADALEGLLRE